MTGTTAALLDNNGDPLDAQTDVTNGLCVFAYAAKVIPFDIDGQQHAQNVFPDMSDARSYAVSVWMKTDAQQGQIFQMVPIGTVSEMSQAVVTG